MPNIAPVAVLTASATSVKLPANRITFDLTLSYDPNEFGIIIKKEITVISGTGFTYENRSTDGNKVDVVFTTAGSYVVQGKVTDRGLLTGTTTVTVTVEAVKKTTFGANGDTITSSSILQLICGTPSVTRSSERMNIWNGRLSNEVESMVAAGHTTFYNVNWHSVEKDRNGQKVPNKFPSDKATYVNKVQPLLKLVAAMSRKDKVIMVCENEPTTESFYVWDGPAYIQELKWFGEMCDALGLKWVDGGVHILTVNGANDPDGQGKSAQVAFLLQEYAKIPTMYAVNMHGNNQKGFLTAGSIVKAVTKVKALTGHNTVSNEWHVQNGTADIIKDFTEQWYDAGVEFSVYITGTDPDSVLNKGTTLTTIGKAYKDKIASLR